MHGLKHQTIDSAHGMTVDIYEPTSLSRNDITLVRDSKINDRVHAATTRYEEYPEAHRWNECYETRFEFLLNGII